MRRLIAILATMLLLLLGTQIALAQYSTSGTLTVATLNPSPGGTDIVSGNGFSPVSQVQITIQSTPALLATVTTNAAGSFSATVTIPSTFSGSHTLVATGVDPSGSVRVLSQEIIVGIPSTSTTGSTVPVAGSDSLVLGLAGLGIVLLTGAVLFSTRKRGSVR